LVRQQQGDVVTTTSPDDEVSRRAALERAIGAEYELGRELGRGGMATVYLAHDRKHDRSVALKVLHPDLGAALGPERFEREIRLAARLQHPHILPVFDSGDAGGRLWYTMPYVEGESLRDRVVREIQLPVEEAVRVVREAAQGLHYAHQRGVVHRDVKPENILLTQDGTTLVADFGIARVAPAHAPPGQGNTRLTGTGLAVGTPAYMSPEQAAGEGDVDARTDVYALGAVLYELLAGEPPFTGPTPQAVLAKRFATPAPSIRVVRPGVPDAIATVLARALATVPADRYATAGDFAAALGEALRAPSPVQTRGERGRTSPQRRHVLVALGVAGFAALGTGAWWLQRRTTDGAPVVETSVASRSGNVGASQQSLAVLPLVNVGGDTATEYFADGMTDELTGALARVPGLKVVSRTSAFAFKGKRDVDVREVARRLGVRAVLEGTVRKAQNQVRVAVQLTNATDGYTLWSEAYDRPLADVFAVQNDVSHAVVTALQGRLSAGQHAGSPSRTPRDPEAYLLYLKALHVPYTPKGQTEAVALLQQSIARDSTFADAYAFLSSRYSVLAGFGTLPDSVADARAMAAAKRALGLDPNLPEAHFALAFVLGMRLDLKGGEASLRRGLELKPSDPDGHSKLAMLKIITGGLSEDALREQRLAEQLDPLSVGGKQNLGTLLLSMHRDAEAAELFRAATVIDPTYPGARSALGVTLARLGKDAEAVAAVQQALNMVPDDPDFLADLAYVHIRAGRPERARAILAELQGRPAEVRPTLLIASIQACLGDIDAAFASLKRVQWNAFGLIALRSDVRLDSLRGDPRYGATLKSLGLE
jgi:serine/threonine-protein kinase